MKIHEHWPRYNLFRLIKETNAYIELWHLEFNPLFKEKTFSSAINQKYSIGTFATFDIYKYYEIFI